MKITRDMARLLAEGYLKDGSDKHLSDAQRRSPDYITIPRWAADMIADALRSLPKGTPGRPDLWTSDIEMHATAGLLFNGRPLRALAREISEVTGQPEGSVRRRLQGMNKSKRLKDLRALSAEYERRAAKKGGEQSPPILRR